jgi:hypothetical protein
MAGAVMVATGAVVPVLVLPLPEVPPDVLPDVPLEAPAHAASSKGSRIARASLALDSAL